MTLLGRQGELLEHLRRELLTLPSSPPANKLESAVGPLAGADEHGPPPRAAPSTVAGGRCRRWRRGPRGSSKRGRDDEVTNGEYHGEDPAAAARPHRRLHSCKRRWKMQQSGTSTSMLVTSAPDLFNGYQWRKYGQKQIEGAMYPRSYYRCARSAEQGCPAKRTVQRNDDNGGAATAAPKYTVVCVGEHTCTANDSPEPPVILETTAGGGGLVLRPDTASSSSSNRTTPTPSSAAASCSTSTSSSTTAATATAAGTTELSPAISDNTWSTITSSVSDWYVDDYYGGLFAAVHDNDWALALAASSPSSSSFPTIEDFTGPIQSPVHISATTDGWTIDQLLLQQLVNEPTICHHLGV